MTMEPIYARIRSRAREIASRYPQPDFYKAFPQATQASRELLKSHAILIELKQFVAPRIDDDFGHGLDHVVKVSLDAAALMNIEGNKAGYSPKTILRRMLLVQCAGLLHDICRKEKDHAVRGADYARNLLKGFALSPTEIDDVCLAIRNHQAFQISIAADTPEGTLVSDCLYDADKFRWGPDNFTDTVWKMVSFRNPPLSAFIGHYPKGMAGISRIRSTFRTATGKKYGPQFIDLGLAIGEELFEVIKIEFAPHHK
jgi:hypothetical protein